MLSPVRLRPGTTRCNEAVAEVTAFVADIDGSVHPQTLVTRLREQGVAFQIHSTFNSTPERPKFRCWVPLARPVPGWAWATVWPKLNRVIALGKSDPATKAASQAFYLPSHRPGQRPCVIVGEGQAYVPEIPPYSPAEPGRTGSLPQPSPLQSRDYSPAEVLATAAWLADVDAGVGEALTFGLSPRGSSDARVDRSLTGYTIIVSTVRHGVPKGLARELVQLAGCLKRTDWFESQWTKAAAKYRPLPRAGRYPGAKLAPFPSLHPSLPPAAHRERGRATTTEDLLDSTTGVVTATPATLAEDVTTSTQPNTEGHTDWTTGPTPRDGKDPLPRPRGE